MKNLSSEKADVEIVGHIIILGLTITGIAMITLVGVPAIYNLQQMANIRNVEQMYTMLDSRASKVTLGEAQRQVIDVNPGGGSLSVMPNSSSQPSYISFEIRNGSSTSLISIPMGKIAYRMGDREVAYEGGGVWSKYPEGSIMLSPPEFGYNGVTMNFPVINISGNFSAGGEGATSLSIEKGGDVQVIYPNITNPNPLSANITRVNITVKSEYYDAWGDYFRSINLIKVNEFTNEKKVVVTLETPPVITNFTYGALASDSIVLDNNAETDSYNSSIGPYSSTKSGNGSIRAARFITIRNNAIVNGSAMTGGEIDGGGEIKGDAYADEIDDDITVRGEKYGPVEGITMGSTANLVQQKINDTKSSNDNNISSLSGECLTGAGNRTLNGVGTGWYSGGSGWNYCRIYTGSYYLTTFSLSNKEGVIFDTTSGPITIAVDSAELKLDNSANITINGNNPIKVYSRGKITFDNNVQVNPTTNQKSNLSQFITSSPQNIIINNNVEFYGFIWAPYASITVDNNAQVYGAMVGRIFTLSNNEEMHYDEALQNLGTQVATGTTVMYLYITRSDVKASVR